MRIGRERVSSYMTDFFYKKYPSWNPYVSPEVVRETSSATTITASATINTKGSWSQVIASTASPGDILKLTIDVDASTINTAMLIDIGFGGSGSEVVVIPNVTVAAWNSNTIEVPIKVPQGTRIAARCQAAVASRTGTITIAVVDSNSYEFAPTSVDILGANTATSLGTALGSAGGYNQIVASTTKDYQSFILLISVGDSTMTTTTGYAYIGIGAAGSEAQLFGYFWNSTSLEAITYFHPPLSFTSPYVTQGNSVYPAGSRISVGSTVITDIMHGAVLGIPMP